MRGEYFVLFMPLLQCKVFIQLEIKGRAKMNTFSPSNRFWYDYVRYSRN